MIIMTAEHKLILQIMEQAMVVATTVVVNIGRSAILKSGKFLFIRFNNIRYKLLYTSSGDLGT